VFYGPVADLTTDYSVREEAFPNNPATGRPWTVQGVRAAKRIYQQVTMLPRARLTELVLFVTVERSP